MPEELSQYYTGPGWSGPALNGARRYYDADIELTENPTLLEALRGWERLTRFSGPLFVAILIPALAAPFVTRGRARAGVLLMLAVGLTLLVVPAATIFYDYRFAIPALGAFATAAALGARPHPRGAAFSRRIRQCPTRSTPARFTASVDCAESGGEL
jgi:hypothetical protein